MAVELEVVPTVGASSVLEPGDSSSLARQVVCSIGPCRRSGGIRLAAFREACACLGRRLV